jgi:hypothetical protein
MFRTRLPRNGSPLANALLVLAGLAAGFGVSLVSNRPDGQSRNFVQAREGMQDRRPSARETALQQRTGGRFPAAPEPGPGRDAMHLAGDATSVANSSHANEKSPLASDDIPVATLTNQERGSHFRDAGAVAARENLHEALTSASNIESAQDRLDFFRGIFGVWSKDDPEGALSHAKSELPAGQLRSEVIGLSMNKWGQDRPREAWLWADENLQGPLKDRALTDLTVGWTRRNPEEAATWLASTGLTSQPLFTALPGTWAEADPKAAATWVKSLPDGRAKDTAEVAVAEQVANGDPSEAAHLYEGEIKEGSNPALTVTIANIWATTDPAAAADWVAALPEGASKQEAAATLATVWAASDIHGAISWTEKIQDPSVKKQVISNIGTTWAAIDPQAALTWLDAQPAEITSDGITGAFYSWAGTDPIGLREWIDAGETGSHADRARQSLADVLSQQNIADSLNLALGMESAVARDQAAARYFREWRKRDDASAQDWLDASWSTLPDTTRTELAKEQARVAVQK